MKFLKSFLTLVLVFGFLAILPGKALADGMVIEPNPYSGGWDFSNEANQQVFINYENGIQKMIVSIGFENKIKNKSVWIFPVPADPQKVVIDNLSEIPRLNGQEITSAAKANLYDIQKIIHYSQIYPAFYYSLFGFQSVTTSALNSGSKSLGVASPQTEQDVQVYEHLEKEGISTEIVTAKTADGLFDYLKKQDLKIDKGTIPVLDDYIGKDYTFVVSWLTPQDTINNPIAIPAGSEIDLYKPVMPQYYNAQKGVAVSFPTEKMYFPLKPTSVYKSKVVPATIKVMGYVSPEIFLDIKSYTKIDYYNNGTYYNYSYKNDSTLSNFITKDKNSLKYTRINIDAPSKLLTEDLWIKNQAPVKANYASFWTGNELSLFIIGVILLLICSFVASWLAGLVIFKEWRNKAGFWKFGLLGLTNILSIIGYILVSMFLRTKSIKPEDQALVDQLKQKGYAVGGLESRDSRKLLLLPLFSVIFMVLSWLVIKLFIWSI